MENIPVSWAALGLIILCTATVGGAVISALMWVYRECNTIRDAVYGLRVEAAQSYVTTSALHEVENRLDQTMMKLGDRLDRSIEHMVTVLREEAVARVKAVG